MTPLCHNLTNPRLFQIRQKGQEASGERGGYFHGLPRLFGLSNRKAPCYISRAARTPPRRSDFRGVEQPGSSSGS